MRCGITPREALRPLYFRGAFEGQLLRCSSRHIVYSRKSARTDDRNIINEKLGRFDDALAWCRSRDEIGFMGARHRTHKNDSLVSGFVIHGLRQEVHDESRL